MVSLFRRCGCTDDYVKPMVPRRVKYFLLTYLLTEASEVLSVCLDAATGSTDDYVKSIGVKYAFTAELRGDGFVIDKREIQPSFEELWSGVVAMCDTIAAKQHQ